MKMFAGIGVVLVVITGVVVITVGCGSTTGGRPSASVPATTGQGNPNYANSSNWLALPAKTTKKVDVFYLSDTTYQKADASAPNIGPIDDPKMRAGAKAKFSATATAFETVADISALQPAGRCTVQVYPAARPAGQA